MSLPPNRAEGTASYAIRPVTQTDLDRLLALLKESAPEADDLNGSFSERPNIEGFVVESGSGEAAGYLVYSTIFDLRAGTDTIVFQDIFVSPSHRKKGLGKGLMQALFKHCGEQGIRRIDWTVDRLDLDLRAFYEMVAPDSFKLNRLTYSVDI